VWGDEDVFMRPLKGARQIAAIRDSHLVRLPEAGHAPWLQHPARVGHVVAEHLGAASIVQNPPGGQPR
jgi:pimeloyl-ACP methyl ester carboxylesterase